MARHAIALGYFFLAAFGVYTVVAAPSILDLALLGAALIAFVSGLGYLIYPHSVRVRASLRAWFIRLAREADRPPHRASKPADENAG